MKRWHEEIEHMKSQMRLERAKHGVEPDNNDGTICHCLLGIGFVRKRKAYDCGNTRCGLCHWGKWLPKRRGATKRRAIKFDLDAWGED